MIDLLKSNHQPYLAIGVDVLTGEADGTNLGRLLCDLNEEATVAMEEFLGGGVQLTRKTGWNHQDWCSMLLTGDTLRKFLIFYYLRQGYEVAELTQRGKDYPSSLNVLETEEDNADFVNLRQRQHDLMEFDEEGFYKGPGNYWLECHLYYAHGTRGTRNQHEMSGRTV